MATAAGAVLLAWWSGCGPFGANVHAYGFIFHETTGITTYLLIDGKEQAVQFTPQSSQLARDTLLNLDAGILYQNADGHHIVVVGILDPATKRTPSAPSMAQSEEYREFTLKRWYIVTPFVSLTDAAEAPDLTDTPGPYTRVRTQLERSDFERLPHWVWLDRRALQRLSRPGPSGTVQAARAEAEVIERRLAAIRKQANAQPRTSSSGPIR